MQIWYFTSISNSSLGGPNTRLKAIWKQSLDKQMRVTGIYQMAFKSGFQS